MPPTEIVPALEAFAAASKQEISDNISKASLVRANSSVQCHVCVCCVKKAGASQSTFEWQFRVAGTGSYYHNDT